LTAVDVTLHQPLFDYTADHASIRMHILWKLTCSSIFTARSNHFS